MGEGITRYTVIHGKHTRLDTSKMSIDEKIRNENTSRDTDEGDRTTDSQSKGIHIRSQDISAKS